MKYAVISDIHANESALQQVLTDAREQGAEKIICLGDIVGYGPLPAESVALIRAQADLVLAGNHDDAVTERCAADDFIDLAGEAVSRHRAALNAVDREWLKSLPYRASFGEAEAAHANFLTPEQFDYIETEDDAAANFAATDGPLMFVGHTHVPALFLTGQSGKVYRLEAQDFVLEEGKRYLVNVGSVGYPREENGVCLSTYALYDSSQRTVRFRRLPFSVASVMQRGHRPRRHAWLVVAALALAMTMGLGAFFFYARPQPTESVAAIAERTLTLTPRQQSVRPNLVLAREGASAMLRVEFLSAADVVLGSHVQSVRLSAKKGIKVPDGTCAVRLRVLPLQKGKTPKVMSFAPAAQ